MNIADHILHATGTPRIEEPRGIHGDWLVGAFCLGVALGWLVGAAC